MSLRPKPRKSRPGVEAIPCGGQWKWRATLRVKGVRERGTVRLTEEEAYADALEIRDRLEQAGGASAGTLGQVFTDLIEDARSRGVKPISVRGVYENPAKAVLLNFIPAETPLASIDEYDLRELVRTALDRGLAARTITRNYLRVLNQAFELAKVPSPAPAVRKSMRNTLKIRRFEGPFLTIDQCGRLIRDMLEHPKPGRRMLDNRQLHVNLVLILMTTGCRQAEFSRCNREDLDLEVGLLRVREPKDSSSPSYPCDPPQQPRTGCPISYGGTRCLPWNHGGRRKTLPP